MNELNNATINEAEVTQATVNEAVVTQADVQVIPEKKGMSTGQKLAGLGLIGLAIAGIVWLITGIVKGVKKVAAFFKKNKEEAPAQQPAAPAPAATPEQPAPQKQENVQKEETTEQK